LHFETVPGDLDHYRTFLFGVAVQDFPVESLVAFVIFHGDRMENRQELVGVAPHPGVAGGQHQPGDADRKEQQ